MVTGIQAKKLLTAYKNLTLNLVGLINAPRGHSYEQYRTRKQLASDQKQTLIDGGQTLMARNLAHATTAEISILLQSQQLVINTQDSNLSQLDEQSFVICSTTAKKPGDLTPKYLKWHSSIYQTIPDAWAVIFCHPPFTFILANAKLYPKKSMAPDIFEVIENVTIIARNDDVGQQAQAHHALMIPQVGTIVWGRSLPDALDRVEALEYVSRLTALAYQTGLEQK